MRFLEPLKNLSTCCVPNLLSLIFPRRCLHCQQKADHHLCVSCRDLLQPDLSQNAPFPYFGPAQSILKMFCSGKMPGLAPAMAGWMVAHLIAQGKPLPDVVIPVPERLLHAFRVGYCPAHLLATHISRYFGAACSNPLKWKTLRLRQERLSSQERKTLPLTALQWKRNPPSLAYKNILIVDVAQITGTTLARMRSKLKETFPKNIETITFCYDY